MYKTDVVVGVNTKYIILHFSAIKLRTWSYFRESGFSPVLPLTVFRNPKFMKSQDQTKIPKELKY